MAVFRVGRYQNSRRYLLRYLIFVDGKEVRRKGSEVATSEPVFLKNLTGKTESPRELGFWLTHLGQRVQCAMNEEWKSHSAMKILLIFN